MDANVCPCKYCVAPKRYPGCHAECPEYIDWNTDHQEHKVKVRDAIHLDYISNHLTLPKNRTRRKR